MSVYCRPIVVEDGETDTRIVCMCGWERVAPAPRARRAYYQHQPNASPIPMPHIAWEPRPVETPPEPSEIYAMHADMSETRDPYYGPDPRESLIARCPACGDWTWRNTCRVAGCWAAQTSPATAGDALSRDGYPKPSPQSAAQGDAFTSTTNQPHRPAA